MTLWEPSPQGFWVLRQNSPKFGNSVYLSEISNLCTFASTQYEFSLDKELVYPV